MNPNRKKILTTVAAIALIAAAFFLFFSLNPARYPIFPKCPFLQITGYECPGCGSQRAIHQLLHLRIGSAFRYNPLMVLLLPYIFLGIYIEYLGGKNKFPKLHQHLFGRWAALVLFVVVVAYWIGRNIV